jgi:hypothetical protein
MFDTTDAQICSLLENRAMLRRALTMAALEASAGDPEVARVRVLLWISDASDAIERESKGAK